MHINLESTDKHSIQAYNEQEIKINARIYQKNFIVNPQEIVQQWPINGIESLDEEHLALLLRFKPEIILIGHRQPNQLAPFSTMELLAKQRIGFEAMSIAAACRTFNILLGELRRVTLGIILE